MSTDPAVEPVASLQSFVAAVPGAEVVLNQHLVDYQDVNPHLLMVDLRQFFVTSVAAEQHETVAAFATGLETLATSEHWAVRNVVETSFIEDLVVSPDDAERAAIETMRPLLGPVSAQTLEDREQLFG